jgi:NitT/TauT family transport system substrate-binding protein
MNSTESCKLSRMLLVFGLSLIVGFAAMGEKANAEPGKKLDKIVFATPFAPIAIPMAYIKKHNLMKDYSNSIELKVWDTPDQLRTLLSRQEADFVSIPSNTASIFYNKGIKLKLMKISIWKVFYIISADKSITSVKDLKGKQIFIPFRGDQPDLIFQSICKGQGLDPETYLQIQYTPSPLDVIMNMVGGKAKYAMMIEPSASLLIMKGKEKGLEFARVIDIQKEWNLSTGLNSRIPNSGVAVLPKMMQQTDIVSAFSKAYDEAVAWTIANPVEAGVLAAEFIEGVNAAAFTESLKYTTFESVNSENVKNEIEKMFSLFYKLSPQSIGGKLPDDDFYFGEKK